MEESCVWYEYYIFPDFVNNMYTTEHYKCDEPDLPLGEIRYFSYCPYCGKKMKIKSKGTLKHNDYWVKAEVID